VSRQLVSAFANWGGGDLDVASKKAGGGGKKINLKNQHCRLLIQLERPLGRGFAILLSPVPGGRLTMKRGRERSCSPLKEKGEAVGNARDSLDLDSHAQCYLRDIGHGRGGIRRLSSGISKVWKGDRLLLQVGGRGR